MSLESNKQQKLWVELKSWYLQGMETNLLVQEKFFLPLPEFEPRSPGENLPDGQTENQVFSNGNKLLIIPRNMNLR